MQYFPLSLLLLASTCLTAVDAQRDKQTCYEKYMEVISCNFTEADNPASLLDVDDDEINYSQAEDILWLEETCRLIEEVVFKNELIVEPEQQIEYLNGLPAVDELCTDIPVAFHHCRFCNDTTFLQCHNDFIDDSICTKEISAQEVLRDNETYWQFQTKEDIELACEELSQVPEHNDTALGFSGPRTMELCEKQGLVKHLCKECKNDALCFDPFEYPTQCAAIATYNNESAKKFGSNCSLMLDILSAFIPEKETLLNTSTHLEKLAILDGDHEWCPDFREAYSYCPWCTGDFCFDDAHPPSCEKVDDSDIDDEFAEKVCTYLFEKLQLGTQHAKGKMWDFNDLYNSTAHANLILIPNNTERCDQARKYYHKCSWCDEQAKNLSCGVLDPCTSNITMPDHLIPDSIIKINTTSGNNLTGSPEDHCDYLLQQLNLTQRDDTARAGSLGTCMEDFYLARQCPQQYCPDTNITEADTVDKTYLGATGDSKEKALIWTSRVAALLSFLGASYILYDTLSDKKARKTTYYQLLVGMATFDIVTAIAWSFATLPIDTDKAEHVEGAMGNAATCKTQAFFIQLGFTSVFFNVSLAIYYVLVVAHGWKEFQLQKIRLYLLAGPVAVGLGLAFGALPIYHWLEYGCHIETPPEGELWAVLVFVVLPLGLSILAITASMMTVYCKVRKQSAAARKWTMGVSKASKLEQAVFWQCLFYVMAFYITWPILFSVYLASLDDKVRIFGLSMLVAFVAPLQGFNNFLVYIRPKLAQRAPSDLATAINCTTYCVRAVLAQILFVSSFESGQDENGLDPSAAVAQRNVQTQSTVPASSRFSHHGEDYTDNEGEPKRLADSPDDFVPLDKVDEPTEVPHEVVGDESMIDTTQNVTLEESFSKEEGDSNQAEEVSHASA
ncbi:expressed unknown protein [Seminavis robusta]|uniref:G-protein coupled receptors family 1 profile domain-containing protein n=1 Tax=Seminavis robusta TaxID=568900 RepID=A0A9N8DMA1_9STRA|nr:expressed unknown protein [Seminavis robusta]|eukprot:Sro162_g072880.1 n/a (899) ;mRNA; r:57934-60630